MYELIEHKKLDSSAASITFSNIPQTYTDLLVVLTARSTDSTVTFNGGYDPFLFRLNNSDTGYSSRSVNGTGSAVDSDTEGNRASALAGGNWGRISQWGINNANQTTNTFSSIRFLLTNYKQSSAKAISAQFVSENNATNAFQAITAQTWSGTAAVTSVSFALGVGAFVQHSSATLYGINRTQAIGRPKAVGGNITYANGYWVHTFTGSGSFYAQEDLEVDALLVAGGGGASRLGGGGAGGLLTAYGAPVSAGSYPIVIGGGGLGVENSIEYNGSDSTFLSYRAIGGGAGSSTAIDRNGQAGGSGGGAWPVGTGGAGTSGQGNAGGSAGANSPPYGGGGGGGAGAIGSNQQGGNIGGPGGAGLAYGITGNTVYYAGGGAGGDVNSNSIAGGIGGGGSSPNNKDGVANTGGGGGAGGGALGVGGNGGSGVVIVRYKA